MIELFHPGVASLTPAQPHTIGEIDHEISSLAILLSSAEARRVFCQACLVKTCGVHDLRL